MITIADSNENNATLVLEGELTIYAAENFYNELNSHLKNFKDITIDMTDVEELDTSCYQILLRAKLLAKKNNNAFNISKQSEATQQVFNMYDSEGLF